MKKADKNRVDSGIKTGSGCMSSVLLGTYLAAAADIMKQSGMDFTAVEKNKKSDSLS